jgi:hypothetical protein
MSASCRSWRNPDVVTASFQYEQAAESLPADAAADRYNMQTVVGAERLGVVV